jgi:large subunit ribosomal protein L34e
MPSGKLRSRRFIRKNVRLPGKKNVIHYRKRKPSKASCQKCGGLLGGVPTVRDPKRRHLSKSKRRPTRSYAGNICPNCLKLLSKEAIYGNI